MAKSFDLFLLVDFDAPVVELAVEIRLGNTRPCFSQGKFGTVLGTRHIFNASGMAMPSCFFSGCLSKTFDAARFMLLNLRSEPKAFCNYWSCNLCVFWRKKAVNTLRRCWDDGHSCIWYAPHPSINCSYTVLFTRPKPCLQDSCTTYCLELGNF